MIVKVRGGRCEATQGQLEEFYGDGKACVFTILLLVT